MTWVILMRVAALKDWMAKGVLGSRPADRARWRSEEALEAVRSFATGIGPQKSNPGAGPRLAERTHAAGLTVSAWTFGANTVGMEFFFRKYGVDALFTDNHDRFPR